MSIIQADADITPDQGYVTLRCGCQFRAFVNRGRAPDEVSLPFVNIADRN